MDDLEARLTQASTGIVEPGSARCDRGREAAMAWAADDRRPRPSRPGARNQRVVTVLASGVAVAIMAVIVVFGLGTRSADIPSEPTGSVSDEVMLGRIAAALDPGDRIEHARWVEQGRRIELWSRRGGESVMTDSSNRSQDPSKSHTNTPICSGLARDRCRTTGEAFSRMLRSGHVTVLGRVADGDREVIRIAIDTTMTVMGMSGTVDIDSDTLLIVGVDLMVPGSVESSYRYELYEFLPPTAENLAIFDQPAP